MSNKELYERCKERELSIDMKIARWRTFGHVLRLPIDTPCQKAMQWYFEIPHDSNKYRGNQRMTLPILLHNDIIEINKIQKLKIKQFKSAEDLIILRELASDREQWKMLSTLLCGIA